MTDYNHLFQYERDIYNPTIRRDPAKLGPLLAPGFFEYISTGELWERQPAIDSLAVEPADTPIYEPYDFQAFPLADTVVLVTYRTQRPDAPPMVRSSIWRKNGDQWQLEFHQVTRVLDAV